MEQRVNSPETDTSFIEPRVSNLEVAVFGSSKKPGLTQRVDRIETFMFADPQTGSRGLVATVQELTDYVRSLQVALRTLNWILGLIGTGGLVALLRWALGA